jgi:NitT/TauT family transport system ATP-binding protein
MEIQIQDVRKTYSGRSGPVVALDGISSTLTEGEFICLVGPSGCGKSTLLNMLAGFDTPTSGHITLDGQTISGPSISRAMMFQEAALFPWLSALGNVEFGLKSLGLGAKERRERAQSYLEMVHLGGFGEAQPHELSGGMKQRVSIARGLAQDPPVLLMDEPFAALDEQTRMTMGDELLRIWAETRKTVVFVTHSLTEAVYLADEVIVMSARPGRIIDRIRIELPRPRTFEMLGGEVFGRLRDRIWRQIRAAA